MSSLRRQYPMADGWLLCRLSEIASDLCVRDEHPLMSRLHSYWLLKRHARHGLPLLHRIQYYLLHRVSQSVSRVIMSHSYIAYHLPVCSPWQTSHSSVSELTNQRWMYIGSEARVMLSVCLSVWVPGCVWYCRQGVGCRLVVLTLVCSRVVRTCCFWEVWGETLRRCACCCSWSSTERSWNLNRSLCAATILRFSSCNWFFIKINDLVWFDL